MPLKTYGSARLVGAEAMVRVLRSMPKEVSDKVVASAVRAGAAVVRKEAIARAPKRTDGKPKRLKTKKTGVTLRALYGAIVEGGSEVRYPGNLKKSIRALRTRKTEHDVTYLVGPTGRGFYGLFLEFGTSRQAKRPWLRPAFEATADRALATIGKTLGTKIEQAAKKLAGRFRDSGLGRKRGRRR